MPTRGEVLEGPVAPCVHASQRTPLPDPVGLNWPSSAFHKISNEILIHIFGHVVQQDAERSPIRPLLAVCKHWREVAISTPLLWVFIAVGRGTDWLDLCLQRSAKCAIDVHLIYSYPYAPTVQLRKLSPHRGRIRKLTLRPPKLINRSDLIEFFGLPWPALEVLRFTGFAAENIMDMTLERYPKIRELFLDRTAPRDPLIYAQLCSLSLADPASDFTFHDFMQLLSHASSLEKLNLYCIISSLKSRPEFSDAPQEHQEPTMVLPQLAELNIVDRRSQDIASFLGQFSLPQAKYIDLYIDDRSAAENWQGSLSESLGDILPHLSPSAVCCLPLLARTTHISVTAWEEEYSIYAYATRNHHIRERELVRLSLDAGHYWDDDGFYDVLRDFVSLFSEVPIRSVVFQGGYTDLHTGVSDMVNDWETVFSSFPLLETIELEGHGISTWFWMALEIASARIGLEPGGDDNIISACPLLRAITYGDGDHEEGEGFFEALVSCLRYRAERGSRLETLKLFTVDHESFKMYLPQLETLVNSVEYEADETVRSRPPREVGDTSTTVQDS